jgi:hypothetical protein
MPIYLLDESLKVEVFFDKQDCDFEDNVCLCFFEDCPPDEKIFKVGETNVYLTAEQALRLGHALIDAATESIHYCVGH